MSIGLLFWVMKVFWNWCWWLCKLMTILKTTELYTFKGRILWYVNYISTVIKKRKSCHLSLGILPIYEIKNKRCLYLALCLVRRGAIWKLWSQPGVTGCSSCLPIFLATPYSKARTRWGKKKHPSCLLEGTECDLMLEIPEQQEMLLNNHAKRQMRIIFQQLGLGTQVLRGNPHWGEKRNRSITNASRVPKACRPAPSLAPWQSNKWTWKSPGETLALELELPLPSPPWNRMT